MHLQAAALLAVLPAVAIAQSTGKTTRYWDCCKPSCAWPGKSTSSSPVKTCDKNDNPLNDGGNTKSGCDNGGGAFMCSNQSPWAVSDTLAYGWAAVNIAGSNEAAWCCACYELTFTSAPLQGKKMIVQATNTGGDLGNNHFDLAVRCLLLLRCAPPLFVNRYHHGLCYSCCSYCRVLTIHLTRSPVAVSASTTVSCPLAPFCASEQDKRNKTMGNKFLPTNTTQLAPVNTGLPRTAGATGTAASTPRATATTFPRRSRPAATGASTGACHTITPSSVALGDISIALNERT